MRVGNELEIEEVELVVQSETQIETSRLRDAQQDRDEFLEHQRVSAASQSEILPELASSRDSLGDLVTTLHGTHSPQKEREAVEAIRELKTQYVESGLTIPHEQLLNVPSEAQPDTLIVVSATDEEDSTALDLHSRLKLEQELLQEAAGLARRTARGNYREGVTQAEIEHALESLWKSGGEHLSQDEWRGVVDRYTKVRNRIRERELLREVRRLAMRQARRDFDRDPSRRPAEWEIRRDLEQAMRNHADVQGLDSLRERMLETYEQAYEHRHRRIFKDELNWFQEKYYEAKSWIRKSWRSLTGYLSSVASTVARVGEGLYAAAAAVIELSAETAMAAAAAAKRAADKVHEVVTDPKTYEIIYDKAKAVGEVISSAAGAVRDFIYDPATWDKIGDLLGKGWEVISDPKRWERAGDVLGFAFDIICDEKTWEKIGGALQKAHSACVDFTSRLILDPKATLSEAWEKTAGARKFLGEMCKQLGLTDIAGGVKDLFLSTGDALRDSVATIGNLISDIGKVASGEISAEQLKQNLKQNILATAQKFGEGIQAGLRAIKGGVLLLGELTGVTDVLFIIRHGLAGEWGMAAMYGGFALMSVGTLAATIATVGGAAPSMLAVMTGRASLKAASKKVLSVAGQNFFERSGKEMGTRALREIEEKVGRDAFQKMLREGGAEVVDHGSQELAERVAKEGSEALTHESIERQMKTSAKGVTDRILREVGLDNITQKLALNLFKGLEKMNVRQIARRLVKSGVADKRTAKAMAKSAKRTVRSGGSHKAMLQALEDGMTKEVREYVERFMERSFKGRFYKVLRGELGEEHSKILSKAVREQAERLGKNVDELIDEFVEVGWKGAREGIESATRKIIRKALLKALKRFHLMKLRRLLMLRQGRGQAPTGSLVTTAAVSESALEQFQQDFDSKHHHLPRQEELYDHVGIRLERRSIDGAEYLVSLQRRDDGRWHEIATQLIAHEDSRKKDKRRLRTAA